MSDDPRWQMIVAIRASGGADFETARRWEAIALEEHDHLIAAAREEGRREGEAMIADLRRSADASHLAASNNAQRASEAEAALRAERAAHAAQLVALREAAAEAGRIEALYWTWRACGDDAATDPNMTATVWVANTLAGMRADGHPDYVPPVVPLPDAEAALEKVKEEAVREAVMGLADRTIGTELTPIAQVGDEPDWWFNDTAAFRAALLNALGAKP